LGDAGIRKKRTGAFVPDAIWGGGVGGGYLGSLDEYEIVRDERVYSIKVLGGCLPFRMKVGFRGFSIKKKGSLGGGIRLSRMAELLEEAAGPR